MEKLLPYYKIEKNPPREIEKPNNKLIEELKNEVKAEKIFLLLLKEEKYIYQICYVVNTHLNDLEYLYIENKQKERQLAEKGINIKLKATTLAEFEKKGDLPTEEEYYIKKYGIKIYDSGKELEILPKNIPLRLQQIITNYRYARRNYAYIEVLFKSLLRIYIQKKGYLDPVQLQVGEYKEFIKK